MVEAHRRIIFSNNYSMLEARRLVHEGVYPAHHLCGMDRAEEAGFEVVYLGCPNSRIADRLNRLIGAMSGDVRHLWAGLARTGGRRGLIFSGNERTMRGLAVARSCRLLRSPVVGMFHTMISPGRASTQCVRGFDVAICLSSFVREHLVRDHGRAPAATVVLPWGPDLRFPGYRPVGDQVVVSSGKSDRDLRTLVAALGRVGCAAVVHGSPGDYSGTLSSITWRPPGSIHDAHRPEAAYVGVLSDLQRASVVAIPLHDRPRPPGFTGLTELNEALALGKPVIMTRTPNLDFDIQALGFGVLVEPGDVDGWCVALEWLCSEPETRARMGKAARSFCETSWNAELFSQGVLKILSELSGVRTPGSPADSGPLTE